MFNADFFPTPVSVIETMLAGIDVSGKTVLEPSAGKGDMVDYLTSAGATVIACETNPDLAKIVSSKCTFLKPDFLKVKSDEISHVHYIVMNPPFSADEHHIIHAWKTAPEGCEIIALCNWQTVANTSRSHNRALLEETINEFGTVQNLGNVFSSAQRKTDVEIGLIHLYKPRVSAETEFDGYFDTTEETEKQENGIMRHDEIREIVNRYTGAVKMFDAVMQSNKAINDLISPISYGLGIVFGATKRDNQYSTINRDTFKKELQKSAWRSVFNKLKMDKYITRSVKEDLNRFVEQQTRVPFTVKNIWLMLEMIHGTHASRMDRVLVEAFDKICSFSADNSTAGEKWKTNSNYKVNRRFIIPWITEYETWRSDKNHVRLSYRSTDELADIVKALCHLSGVPYESTTNLSSFVHLMNMKWGKWYSWGFFNIRGYKKGTMHFEFSDEKLWERFNRRVAEIKGWQLPEKTDKKQKGTERTPKPTDIIISPPSSIPPLNSGEVAEGQRGNGECPQDERVISPPNLNSQISNLNSQITNSNSQIPPIPSAVQPPCVAAPSSPIQVTSNQQPATSNQQPATSNQIPFTRKLLWAN